MNDQHKPFHCQVVLTICLGRGVHCANKNLADYVWPTTMRHQRHVWYTLQQLFVEKQVQAIQGEAETLAYESLKEQTIHWWRKQKPNGISLVMLPGKNESFTQRNHDERQPYIHDQIIETIRNSPTKVSEKIAADIDHWCSSTTIQSCSHCMALSTVSMLVEGILLPLLRKSSCNSTLTLPHRLFDITGDLTWLLE